MFYIHQIHQILTLIKEDLKRKEPVFTRTNSGLCYNIAFRLGDKRLTDKFMVDALTHINGRWEPYPIEGEQRKYELLLNKYAPNNNFGKKRLELLNALIQYCEDKIKGTNHAPLG